MKHTTLLVCGLMFLVNIAPAQTKKPAPKAAPAKSSTATRPAAKPGTAAAKSKPKPAAKPAAAPAKPTQTAPKAEPAVHPATVQPAAKPTPAKTPAVSSYAYRTAAGIKFYPGALSLKHFVAPAIALEGALYFWSFGFRLTGLAAYHGPIKGAPGLRWYAGGGAHIGKWNTAWESLNPNYTSTSYGIDGVLGLDYKFKDLPLNLSLDWQPSYNLGGYNYLEAGWGGLAIRYTF
jgi:hypothetical protein